MKFNKLMMVSVVTIVGLSALLTGCGNKGDSKSEVKQTASTDGGTPSKPATTDFYKGKTLTVIVPYGPGGGYDQWSRIIAPYMQKYLGASKVDVVNAPGGGGIVGTNKIYTAKPDGLTIGDTNAGGNVFDQMMNAEGAKYDVKKFNWIGRPDHDPSIIAVRPDGPYKTFEDFAKTKTTIKALATGKGDAQYNATVITLNAFGIPFTMVAAFDGSKEEKAAFLRGNGDTMTVSSSDIKEIQDKASAFILNSAENFDKLKEVPTVLDMAKKLGLGNDKINALKAMSDVMDLGHSFFAPPGVPQDRLDTLRKAFEQSVKDPNFVAEATKTGLYVGFVSGEELQKMTANALLGADKLKPLLQTK
jgi:tripartite-type tricarboxylate transporter receptor subunit TctC